MAGAVVSPAEFALAKGGSEPSLHFRTKSDCAEWLYADSEAK